MSPCGLTGTFCFVFFLNNQQHPENDVQLFDGVALRLLTATCSDLLAANPPTNFKSTLPHVFLTLDTIRSFKPMLLSPFGCFLGRRQVQCVPTDRKSNHRSSLRQNHRLLVEKANAQRANGGSQQRYMEATLEHTDTHPNNTQPHPPPSAPPPALYNQHQVSQQLMNLSVRAETRN